MSAIAKAKREMILTHYLYDRMPGAEPPPVDERGKLWGEVENTPHYEFCNAIASLIVQNSSATFVEPD